MVVSRPLHIRESPHAALRPRLYSARRAHAYNRQERSVQRDVREARRCRRNPQRAQRSGQFRQGIRRVLCACVRAPRGGRGGGRVRAWVGGAAARTASVVAQPSSRAAIWACSCGLTAPGGVRRSRSRSRSGSGSAAMLDDDGRLRRRAARLMTAHQIGTVLESASGRRLPARVESTTISLEQEFCCIFRGNVRRSCDGGDGDDGDVPAVGGGDG
jgi:hypothetical protein